MALDMKQRYARLDMSKLPESYTSEFKAIESTTKGFSDATMNGIFAENFEDMYALVEKKYPDAIKSGGTVRKEKPSKVKVVKAKAKEPEEKREVKHTLAGRAKLYPDEIEGIEEAIEEANVKGSTDKNLALYLAGNFPLSKAQAEKWVSQREKFKPEFASKEHKGKYMERTKSKKAARKAKDEKTTLDGFTFNQKDPTMKGKKFYDAKGNVWICEGYNEKAKECMAKKEGSKEATDFCIENMYAQNPVTKREKGNLVDDCKETLKEAGYTVKEHKAGTKKIKRSAPRPEKAIIKERVEETFTPIMKDLKGSEDKEKENKQIIVVLESIQIKFTTIMNRISNMADDNKLEQLKKILKLLDEIVG